MPPPPALGGRFSPRGRFGGSGATNSRRTELTDPPEDWPAAAIAAEFSVAAAAVTPREPHSRQARVWLVLLIGYQ